MRVIGFLTIALAMLNASAAAQSLPLNRGTVRIAVRDATNLPISGAEVSLQAPDGSVLKAKANDSGVAGFEGVSPGRYSARVESAGFDALSIEPFSVPAGERVTRDVTLQVAGFAEQLDVTPAQDDQLLMNAFTRELSPEQLAALPEDPEELALVLQQLVGDDADIRVDGFSGGRLPPGTQIRDIRVRYDGGAASSGGGPRVEIRTTPGGDRWRNNAGVTLRDESLNARNAFSKARPTGQTRQYSWDLNGPVVRNRTGLSVSVTGSESMQNRTIRAAAPEGLFSTLVEQPSRRVGLWTRLDHEITPSQSLRIEFNHAVNDAQNQRISELDLPERAVTETGADGALQIGHHATSGAGLMNDLRFNLSWQSSDVTSLTNTRTIRVLDAFSSGGAQQDGSSRSRTLYLENDLEFTVRRLHRISAGVRVDGSDYYGDENSNAIGTYTFTNLEAFAAGRPTTFTQRLGDPTFDYSMYQVGWHVQDDYRVRRNLMVNLGLRHDFQTHVRDWANFSPRIGVNWTLSSKTRTALRGSVGVFHSSLSAETYQRTLLVDGVRQADIVISDPGFPDPFSAGVTQTALAPSVFRAARDLELPFNRRYTVGVDQPIGSHLRIRSTFSHQRGYNQFRSRDANAPVNGVRPEPSFRTITALESIGQSLQRSLQTDVVVTYPSRRLSANVNYTLGEMMNDADGAFALPPDSFDLTGEWGPARGDVRHRVNAAVNSDLPGQFRINANFRAQSASPYTITTGRDENGDGVYSERPPGVARNSARGAMSKNFDLTVTWGLNVGHRRPIETQRVGSDLRPLAAQTAAVPRAPLPARANYLIRFEVFARANNVLNFVNLQNFSGVLTSPFFGLPTSASFARHLVVGTRVWF